MILRAARLITLAACSLVLCSARAAGPYPAMHETEAGLPDHVIYRPADLSPFGANHRLPVIGWVNGGCVRGSTYASFLEELASHGYIVVAPGNVITAAPKTAPPAPARKLTLTERIHRIKPPETTTAQLIAGVDWVLAQGQRGDSLFAGKIDNEALAMMGHSCGGMQALEASVDPRVKTTLVLASGYWRLGGDLPGIALNRTTLQRLHGPVLYLYGGSGDIVQVDAEADFFEIDQVPIVKAYREVGHGLSLREPQGGDYGKLVIDWLDWQLRGERGAAAAFVGKDCGLCTDPAWDIEKKHIDKN